MCCPEKEEEEELAFLVDSATLVSSSQTNSFLRNKFSKSKNFFKKIQLCSKQKLLNLIYTSKTKIFFPKKAAILEILALFLLVLYVRSNEKRG